MDDQRSTTARWPRLEKSVGLALVLAVVACHDSPVEVPDADAVLRTPSFATFGSAQTTPFGAFNGVAYVRHTGLFEGETSLGAFRVPYDVIAPADPSEGNGTLLVEPPHFATGLPGRDGVLGHDFLFGNGFSHAAVGFGENLLNVLDPGAGGLMLAGAPVARPGTFNPAGVLDEEIIVQFTLALSSQEYGSHLVGDVRRRYAYGVSQTSSVLMELQRTLDAAGAVNPFDLTLLHVALWHSPFPLELAYDRLGGDFEPIDGVGRVLFVGSEGDHVFSDADEFRRAVGLERYRVYEVAGSAHQPTATNPLAHAPVVRALLVAGDAWVRAGVEPPPSTLMQSALPGQIDPVHGFETGIARDADMNALGGIRLPDLEVGRARFIASDPTTRGPGIPPPFAVITGNMVDLVCEPAPGSPGDEPRFRNHGDYVHAFIGQVNELRKRRLLLGADADALARLAAESGIGSPHSCPE